MALVFKDAEKARDAIMASQKKEIAKLYEDWADEIGERANYYSHKSTASSVVSERQMKELQKMLRASSQQVSNEVYGLVKNNIYMVSDEVVKCNAAWLAQFGFSEKGLNAAFSSVPDQTVRNLITGQIYESGWSLSKRIWGDNEATLKDIYQVMAKGLAENKPVYAIAKELEAYVRPSAQLPWNLRMSDGVKIYKKQVDYNAQRLARTLVQHGYQQSLLATTQKNPFVTEYVWHSNGSRVCQLCKDRDGTHYKKNELPMDHPNGMCIMEPVVVDDLVDQVAEWFNSPDGTYPEIDEFAKNFGYEGGAATKAKLAGMPWYKAKNEIGGNWYNAQKYMESKSGTSASAYWKKYVSGQVDDPELDSILGFTGAPGKKAIVPKVVQVPQAPQVKEFSAAQKKYLETLGFAPDNMPKDFDDWSHKISWDMGSEILKSMGTSWSDPHPYQKLMKYYNANLTSANLVNKGVATTATKTTVKTLGQLTKDNIDDYIALANSGDAKAYTQLHKLFSKYGYDIDDLVDDMDQLQVDSFMFKEAKNSVMKKAFGSSTTSAASKIDDVATVVATKTDDAFSAAAWHKSVSNNDLDLMENWTYDWLKTITTTERAGVRKYTSNAYTDMNRYLRGQSTSTRYAKEIQACQSALAKASLPQETIVRRGSGYNMLNELGIGNVTQANKTKFIGAIVQEKGFLSTSPAPHGGFSGTIEYVIKLPQGSQAMYVDSISTYQGEQEMLVNCGGRFIVEDVEVDGWGTVNRIYMTLINLK